MITPEDNLRLAYMVEVLDELIDRDINLSEEELEKLSIARENIASTLKVYDESV